MLVIEQSGPYYYGLLDGVEVKHRLNNREAKELGEECHSGSESTIFWSKKDVVKAARKQSRRLKFPTDSSEEIITPVSQCS